MRKPSADGTCLRYLFVGADGTIARAWWEAAQSFGLDIRQSCPPDLCVPGMLWEENLRSAMLTADVVITDGPGPHAGALVPYRVTAELLDTAPRAVRLVPCPPFIRGREISRGAVVHSAFVGYKFERFLLPVQQAVMARALIA